MEYRTTFLLLIVFLLGISFSGSSQSNLCLGHDTSVCVGAPVTIENCSGIVTNTQGIILNNPSSVTLSDDSWSGVVPIGFDFSFYGNNQTQCVIGSNCILSFDVGYANGYCPWSLSAVGTLPNPGFNEGKNTIMPCYQDINPSLGGQVLYETVGTAPNRMFVVLWQDINFFSCTSVCNYLACILYEGSNNIEVHIGDKPLCSTWNGGLGIQGIQNAAGNVAHITPGRNNTQWSANQEGMRWTPTSPANTTDYTIAPTPYAIITSSGTSFQWESTSGQTYAYNGGVLNLPAAASGTEGFYLTGAACGASLGAVSDTTWVSGLSVAVDVTGTDDLCSSGQGTATATPNQGFSPFTYNWPGLGNNPNPSVSGLTTGNYTVEMTDSMGCTATNTIFIDDTPATFQGTTTLVNCAGGSDGTAFAEMVPQLGNITYQWDDLNNQTTQTATNLPAGQYTCTITSDIGCTGTVTLNVDEIPGITGAIANQTDVTCNSGNDGMIEVIPSQGTAPYTYSWDNSISSDSIADDLYVGTHIVTITDANGCATTVTGVLNEPPALDITFITPTTQICPEDDITLSATGSGGSSPYTFTWYQGATQLGTGDQITVDPDVTNTEYCVVLSEQCGSPTNQECTIITFPVPIEPNALPNSTEQCVPNPFEFENTSANGGEIATTIWDFGTTEYFTIENGNDSTSFYFDDVGTYDLIMTTTSIYGCVYTDTIENIIMVKPKPTADFLFSNNPATMFETSVFMQDISSPDVVSWYWDSPHSVPTSSTQTSPAFMFPDGEIGQYPITLIVETELGCLDTVTYLMHVIEDVLFYAPNAFTPDNDELNQFWKPEVTGVDIYDFDLFIFNRWGEVIWENHDLNVGWDGTYAGKPVQDGMYIWVARVSTPHNDDKIEFSGSINVIR